MKSRAQLKRPTVDYFGMFDFVGGECEHRTQRVMVSLVTFYLTDFSLSDDTQSLWPCLTASFAMGIVSIKLFVANGSTHDLLQASV
jgi:hypothetical protein